MKRTLSLIVLVVVLGAFQLGCETRARLDAQINNLRQQLAQIDAQGARICTPREFAAAESNLEFAREEWSEREYIACQDHLIIVAEKIKAAQNWLSNCVEATPPDKDGDGVPDYLDKCPDTPGPAENQGCPWPDRDNDGVPDNVDRCPDVAGPAANNGCPPDRDNDGVPDADDQCPDVAGPADNHGCPKAIETENIRVTDNAIILKRQINFASGSSVIPPEAFAILNDIVKVLKENKTWRIAIEGHTDIRGGHPMNMRLSQARADAVRNYLMSHGIEAERLTAQGFGPDRPIASNNTNEGRARNRRTEFRIVSR
jgi:outer membrane protein OmpA-like peptidoglycan-associated protein